MKRVVITLLLFWLMTATNFAQSTLRIECHYAESYRENASKKAQVKQDEMVLRIENASSEFFSLWHRRRSEVTDSLLAKGAAIDEVIQTRESLGYPAGGQTYTIYKNYPEKGSLTLTDKLFNSHYLYTEALQTPQWELSNEKSEVAGYRCMKAQTVFLGRTWTAWFTPDIPVSDGPWKLCGLPGLILTAEDEEGDYQFHCIEIVQPKEAPSIRLPKRNYLRVEKEKYLKELFLHYEDFQAYINKQGHKLPQPVGGGDNPLTTKKKFNYIEKLTHSDPLP